MKITIQPAALYSPREAQQILGVGRTRVYQILNSPEFRPIRVGRALRAQGQDLLEFIDRCRSTRPHSDVTEQRAAAHRHHEQLAAEEMRQDFADALGSDGRPPDREALQFAYRSYLQILREACEPLEDVPTIDSEQASSLALRCVRIRNAAGDVARFTSAAMKALAEVDLY